MFNRSPHKGNPHTPHHTLDLPVIPEWFATRYGVTIKTPDETVDIRVKQITYLIKSEGELVIGLGSELIIKGTPTLITEIHRAITNMEIFKL